MVNARTAEAHVRPELERRSLSMTVQSLSARVVRMLALTWLLVVGPADLATTVARLLPRLMAEADPLLLIAVVARAMTAAVGVATGLGVLRRLADVWPLAIVWAALEAMTMAVVLFTTVVPTNRLPGTAPLIAALYGLVIAAVLVAARSDSGDDG